MELRNLLVPIADNPESERAMDVACRLATDRGATITVVNVVEVPAVLPLAAHMTEEEAAAHRLLERAAPSPRRTASSPSRASSTAAMRAS
jgi:nucleotide-binding universal stress UspA family protein